MTFSLTAALINMLLFFFLKSTIKFSKTLKYHNNVKCEMHNFSMKTEHQ